MSDVVGIPSCTKNIQSKFSSDCEWSFLRANQIDKKNREIFHVSKPANEATLVQDPLILDPISTK